MKTKITILFAILFISFSFSQTTEIDKPNENSVDVKSPQSEPMGYNRVEVPPLAPNCKAKWKSEKNKNVPENSSITTLTEN